jgi:hypothetical protein
MLQFAPLSPVSIETLLKFIRLLLLRIRQLRQACPLIEHIVK